MSDIYCCCERCAENICSCTEEFHALRNKWSEHTKTEYSVADGCCCCKENEKVRKVKGRFGLAWIAEGSNKCNCKPCGWQVEFVDTPSRIDKKFTEIIKWVNSPPIEDDCNETKLCCCPPPWLKCCTKPEPLPCCRCTRKKNENTYCPKQFLHKKKDYFNQDPKKNVCCCCKQKSYTTYCGIKKYEKIQICYCKSSNPYDSRVLKENSLSTHQLNRFNCFSSVSDEIGVLSMGGDCCLCLKNDDIHIDKVQCEDHKKNDVMTDSITVQDIVEKQELLPEKTDDSSNDKIVSNSEPTKPSTEFQTKKIHVEQNNTESSSHTLIAVIEPMPSIKSEVSTKQIVPEPEKPHTVYVGSALDKIRQAHHKRLQHP